MDEPEKLGLESLDIAADRVAELLRLFPEIRTEDDKVDFDRLKRVLGEAVDPGRERYGMTWPGKSDCFKAIQAPTLATLRPSRDESVNFDTTENLIIEGDNLEVLKLLQKSYLGQVKMIYIDPPYNTGNDFIYPDNFSESLQTYLQYTGQVDAEGRKFNTNSEADGRFHSKWLNMMYPRLYLARNLLREDGLVFVSIDDSEVKSLRSLMDEVYGEDNFIDCIIWKKRYGGGAKEKYLVTLHEYILVYARSKAALGEIFVPLSQATIDRYYKNKDGNFESRGPFRTHPLESMKSFEERPNLRFAVEAPDGQMVMPKRQWRWSPARVAEARRAGELHFTKDKDGGWVLSSKQYLRDEDGQRETKFFSIIDDVFTQHGTNEMVDIFGDAQVFAFPKPSKLIRKLIELGTSADTDLVLDFFAGSGATGQAVMQANDEDGGARRFVLVQLPEPTERTDFPTITDITRERVRRVAERLHSASAGKLELHEGKRQDRGFRSFKLDESNFTTWEAAASADAAALGDQLKLHVDHVRSGRTPEDLLYEILLKSGFPLTTLVTPVAMAGKTVHAVAEGKLLICLERELTLDLIRAMGEANAERVVCLDEGFAGNDQLKANAVQIFKTKGVTSFKTV